MQKEEEGVVYLLWNRVANKGYVGQAKLRTADGKEHGVEGRWKQHLSNALHRRESCKLLEQAIREYGEGAFTRQVLGTARVGWELTRLEEHYIKAYRTRRPNGYNILLGRRGWKSKARKREKKV